MSISFTPPDVLSGLPADTPLLVAFSGGADSRLLLELTVRWAASHHAPVTAAHLHHGIRGQEADRDEDFCRRTAASLGIDYICRRVNVPALAAASGRSTEWEARLSRYEFFADIMMTRRIPLLLTAHHADDQLETLLLRLLRGSGTHGLGGIPPVRDIKGGKVIRPLLDCTRADILDACREMGLAYVTDSTNLEDDCVRNRLRHHVIPRLEDIAGRGVPQRAAARTCRAAREDDDCLQAQATALFPATTSDPADATLLLSALRALPPAYAKRCMAMAYRAAVAGGAHVPADGDADAPEGDGRLPPHRTLTAAHLEALMAAVHSGRPGTEVALPCGWRGIVRDAHGGTLVFLPPRPVTLAEPAPVRPMRLVNGQNRWHTPAGDVTILLEEAPEPLPPRTGAHILASAVFPADLPRPLWARLRRPGDVILSHGMTKKLKKVLCDQAVPVSLRDRLPLLCLPCPDAPEAPGLPLWFPSVIFRDGWPLPQSGACLRVSVSLDPARPST